MARQISLDFNGAPPSSGGGTDYIPPAKYQLVVTKTSDPGNKSANGKPMVVFNYKVFNGPQKGKRLRDNFVMPMTAEDQKVGLQRLHAALLAMGVKVPADRKFKLDLDTIVGRRLQANVADSILPAQDNRPSRTISAVDEYVIPGSKAAASAPDDEDEEDEDDEDEDESDDDAEDEEDDDDDEEEAPPAATTRRERAAPVAEAPQRRRAQAVPPPPAAARRGKAKKTAPPADEDDDAFPFDNDDDD